MKALYCLIMVLVLGACGSKVKQVVGQPGEAGRDGTDGSSGSKGDKGDRGDDGNNGLNSLLRSTRFNSGLAACASDSGIEVASGIDANENSVLDLSEYSQLQVVCDGVAGNDGSDGVDGQDGQDGVDGQDGADGQDGIDANTTYAITQVIDPCGTAPGFNEVLLRLGNGSLIAHFASGNLQFFTILSNGSYQTTDGTSCNFSVNNGVVSW